MQISWILFAVQLAAQTTFAFGSGEDKRMPFTVPAAPWTLTMPAGDFVIAQQEVKPDGTAGYFYVTGEQSHLNVSFFIEPASQCKDSKTCRDMIWRAGNPMWENPQNVVSSQIGDVSYFEFFMPSFRGQPLRQQNMYAEFVVDGFWVDFHISKVLYKPEEHELFEQLVKAIRFEPKEKKRAS
jgi:hypothetical protein